ncbi:hypothetical protein KI809_04375 [Geobacter pelophilus]|uniref:Uncharacterized protein n=1 Tax=Geoanaerobacter pelophilus TaxID=60036 RepID=A0AAW4L6T8_9BACT|nr:hypothetical protein [Geoanaerobacter pelophilus]MBT0663532.1 hypothetical protein [Geoanaerobacter pelophilus]
MKLRLLICTIISAILLAAALITEAAETDVHVVAQQSKHAQSPGNYYLALRSFTPVIDSGGVVRFEVYITGYGIIRSCKIMMYSTTNSFDDKQSSVNYGVDIYDDSYQFGTSSISMNPSGYFAISFPELVRHKKHLHPFFSDCGTALLNPSMIVTENKSIRAPLQFDLKTKEKIPPGTYSCNLYMTYFNGVEWKGDTQQLTFTVRNILQRNEEMAWYLAVAAAIAAIVSVIFQVFSYFKKQKKSA